MNAEAREHAVLRMAHLLDVGFNRAPLLSLTTETLKQSVQIVLAGSGTQLQALN